MSKEPEGWLVTHINCLPNLKVISIPLLRKNTGMLEVSHKIFQLNGNISDENFSVKNQKWIRKLKLISA